METTRRRFLIGTGALLAAPAIVPYVNLMSVRLPRLESMGAKGYIIMPTPMGYYEQQLNPILGVLRQTPWRQTVLLHNEINGGAIAIVHDGYGIPDRALMPSNWDGGTVMQQSTYIQETVFHRRFLQTKLEYGVI